MRDVTAELKSLRLYGMTSAWTDLTAQGGRAALESSRWLIEHLLQAESTDRAMRSIGYRHFGLEGSGVVASRSSHCSLLLFVGDFRRPLKQKYHLSDCPIPRDHSYQA